VELLQLTQLIAVASSFLYSFWGTQQQLVTHSRGCHFVIVVYMYAMRYMLIYMLLLLLCVVWAWRMALSGPKKQNPRSGSEAVKRRVCLNINVQYTGIKKKKKNNIIIIFVT